MHHVLEALGLFTSNDVVCQPQILLSCGFTSTNGRRRTSNLGGQSARNITQNWRDGRRVTRISYCSFRKFSQVKRISIQLWGQQPPVPASYSYASTSDIDSLGTMWVEHLTLNIQKQNSGSAAQNTTPPPAPACLPMNVHE